MIDLKNQSRTSLFMKHSFDKQEHLVSIIMPSYNSGKYIRETINSIQNQTYSKWELLITDDNSYDNTIDVINDIKRNDPRIKLFLFSQNKGSGAARNNSIKKASGKFIAFCDSDDLWYEFKLENQIKYMISNKSLFTFSSYDIINENSEYIRTKHVSTKVSFKSTLVKNQIGCLTVIYDQELVGKRYMSKIRKRQDYLLWLKILKDINTAYGIQTPLAAYRVRKNSISRNKLKLIKYNFLVYRMLNFSFLKSVILLSIFLVNLINNKLNLFK